MGFIGVTELHSAADRLGKSSYAGYLRGILEEGP